MRRVAIVWVVVVSCGRIGFEPREPPDGPDDDDDAGVPVPDAAACAYLPSCQLGEVTCCTSGARSCIGAGSPCSGTVVECDVYTHRGCPTGWACCLLLPNPARCFSPMLPQPC